MKLFPHVLWEGRAATNPQPPAPSCTEGWLRRLQTLGNIYVLKIAPSPHAPLPYAVSRSYTVSKVCANTSPLHGPGEQPGASSPVLTPLCKDPQPGDRGWEGDSSPGKATRRSRGCRESLGVSELWQRGRKTMLALPEVGNGPCAMLGFGGLNLPWGCSLLPGGRCDGKEGARQQLP